MNQGTASIIYSKNYRSMLGNTEACVVQVRRLDDIYQSDAKIGVLKIDVEGHELKVLQGATRLISESQIRDIIFEDHNHPSPVALFLEGHEFTVFRICKGVWGPLLKPPLKRYVHPWESPNYIGTKCPQRVLDRIKKGGWQSLRNRQEQNV